MSKQLMFEIVYRFDDKVSKVTVYPTFPIAECKLIVPDVLTTTNTWKDDSWVAN